MIRAEHIMHLKLDRNRLLAHRQMPPPAYSTKELTSQIAAIGDTVISELLHIDPEVFQMQLDAARQFKASYLMQDEQQHVIAISAATSLIKNKDIMTKNLILPRDIMWRDPQLNSHYVIGVFVEGSVINGVIPEVSEVHIAGWTETGTIKKLRRPELPPTFKSKLPVVMIPCSELNPISSLITRLTAGELCV